MPSLLNAIVCMDCGHKMSPDPLPESCEICGSRWVDADYDYERAVALWRAGMGNRPASMWRYDELLPLIEPEAVVTMGEGWSPLLRANGLGRELGHGAIFIKDERQSPTGSFKDRQGALTISALNQAGVRECVLASTGNKAAAYAAFCARAGIRLWIFLTSTVPNEKLRELALYGAEVVKVTGTYDQAKKIAQDFAARRSLYYDRGADSIMGREAFKTVAFEIAEQLAQHLPVENGRWRAPDWYVQAVSGGIGPLGVWKGFRELERMGLIDRVPKLALIQSEGCSPMAEAWAAGKRTAEPVVPHTRISVLATGDPGQAYTRLFEVCSETGGTMIAADDGAAFRAMRRLARVEGYSMEPAAAVAFAGLETLLADGTIGADDVVVVNCSGHTFPAEKHILEDQYVLDLEFGAAGGGEPSHIQLEDGLGAALERLDEQVTTIVVIDDNAQDSRLIRRLLQAQKNYRVFEVNSPRDGFDLVRQRKPDLIVLDLTMPELDGFTLLEAFKADQETAHIPVVVVSAKTLTPADRARLEGRAESLWQKGAFNTRELVQHVVETLGGDLDGDGDLLSAATQGQIVSAPKPSFQAAPDVDQRDIVVIDDDHRDARLVRRLLEATGRYRVHEAHDGQSGWRLVREQLPDLIVLDLMLPDTSGEDLLERFKQEPSLADIPVVIMTAKDLQADERERLLGKIISLFQKANLDRAALIHRVDATLRDDRR
ncbi:pyridoxal-phosphate dependent enzyme [Aggregatilinea lenta]|uniref:pyridoxal-phosphate dependent enzyme n=1 Tax=Aggregatilinea lenta TaxID=913108 RepID=UPI000E5BA338|nr:pyridoxal-phosphate dependent enzyme [Aggregatilinea lenta]